MGAIVPIVPGPDAISPAFLYDDGEAPEWGWSDLDALDWRELRDLLSNSEEGGRGVRV